MDIKKKVQLDQPRTLNEFIWIAMTYIKYEEQLYIDNLNKAMKEDRKDESLKNPF